MSHYQRDHVYSPPPPAPTPPIHNQHHDPYDESMGYDNYAPNRGSMADMKLNHYDSDDEDRAWIPREKKRRTCMDRVCCGCCTCCPKWARYCSCILLILLVCLGIVIGVLAALFKTPDIKLAGLDSQPALNINGSIINMNLTLDVSVNNPNIESVTFETIVAKVYYPNHHDLQLGGGQQNNVHIQSNAVTNFTFPFSLSIDTSDDRYKSIAADMFSQCGLNGNPSASGQLKLDYDIVPTVRIIGIPISPTISNSANVPCPAKNGDLSSLGDFASLLGSSGVPGI